MTQTRIIEFSADPSAAVAAAVECLEAGEPVALPTETVYGLAADATQPDAVARIFSVKERPLFDPLIVHLPDAEWLGRVTDVPEGDAALVESLVKTFWPGPLTLVLPRTPAIPDIVTAGLETVAVRRSAHPALARILEAFGRPLAAPSANRFGRISPTTARHVLSEMNGRIRLVVDGGPALYGVESTIAAVRGGRIEILRPGPVTAEELAKFARVVLAEETQGTPEAPGRLKSHYAPRTRFVLCEDPQSAPAGGRRGLLLWDPFAGADGFEIVEILSPEQDLEAAAAVLFSALRKLDDAGLDLIVAQPVPERGIGVAIMDRLRRAAAR